MVYWAQMIERTNEVDSKCKLIILLKKLNIGITETLFFNKRLMAFGFYCLTLTLSTSAHGLCMDVIKLCKE
jgi:hypothetical protein